MRVSSSSESSLGTLANEGMCAVGAVQAARIPSNLFFSLHHSHHLETEGSGLVFSLLIQAVESLERWA